MKRGAAHLYDLLVRHPGEEDVLLVLVRVEAHDVRDLAVAESLDALARFRVPELHLTIITT